MTRLGPGQVGPFLRQQAEELTRIWRMARIASRPEVFPGLADGLVRALFERAGDLLADGTGPEEVWAGAGGLLRWPATGAAAELEQEWILFGEVMRAACEAVNAEPAVASWLAAAVAGCHAGTDALARGGTRPPRLLVAMVFSEPSPPRRRVERGETQA